MNVAHLLAATPQIQRVRPEAPATAGYAYYRLSNTEVEGFVVPDLVDAGRLRNGQDVLIVPLDSGGSGGVFDALLWTRVPHGRWRFVGHVPSANGRLDLRIEGGALVAVIPAYAPNDADCCPSEHRYVRYTVTAGKLQRLGAYMAK